jgi:hypothetical protein
LLRQAPATIVLERDERLDAVNEILAMPHASARSAPAGTPTMPKPKSLLNCQAELLAYLTSGGAISGHRHSSLSPGLRGIDRGLLDLVARFSHDKRLEKIVAVFPKTFELLGDNRDAVGRSFADTCPQIATGRIENARQFYGFLAASGRDDGYGPPYLQDVAACELAFASARVLGGDRDLRAKKARIGTRGCIRRDGAAVLLRCSFDISPIFEERTTTANPSRRDTLLAVSFPLDAANPKVFEVAPSVFDTLAAIDDWTDPVTLGASPDFEELIRDLAQIGLIEVA